MATELANQDNPMSLMTTKFQFGQYWETEKVNIIEAIRMYDQSDCPEQHIPRILMNHPKALEKYMSKTSNKVNYNFLLSLLIC